MSSQVEEETVSTFRRSALPIAIVLATVLAGGTARGACGETSWKDCAGKPWVSGAPDTPIGEAWWPNKQWGPDDEAGSTNWFTKPEVVRRGIAEISEGKVYALGHPYTADMPLFGARKFVLRIPGSPTDGPFGANKLVYNDEFLATEIGQVGTQFDGLGHIGVQTGQDGDKTGMRFYNGRSMAEIGSETGLKKNGIEKLHPMVGRGILIDVAGYRGVDAMEVGQEITMADVRGALQRQGIADLQFSPGDVVLFRTGWPKYWIKDNAKYNSGEPGIGIEVARWLSDVVQAGGVGSDTWATEVVPNPDPVCVFCAVHTHLLVRHGIVNQENLDLEALARDRVYRFMYVFTPVPIAGATGSPGSPIAIK
jgi:kynurenine formamidase